MRMNSSALVALHSPFLKCWPEPFASADGVKTWDGLKTAPYTATLQGTALRPCLSAHFVQNENRRGAYGREAASARSEATEQEPEVKEPPTEKPPMKVPEKIRDDMLEEDRFESTDN